MWYSLCVLLLLLLLLCACMCSKKNIFSMSLVCGKIACLSKIKWTVLEVMKMSEHEKVNCHCTLNKQEIAFVHTQLSLISIRMCLVRWLELMGPSVFIKLCVCGGVSEWMNRKIFCLSTLFDVYKPVPWWCLLLHHQKIPLIKRQTTYYTHQCDVTRWAVY